MQTESFGIFFKLKNGPFLFKVSGAATIVIVIGLYKLYNDGSISDGQLIGTSIGVVLLLDMMFFLMFMLPYLSYKKFLQTSSSVGDDWKLFVMQRSKEFLRGKRHVKVSVSLKPSVAATQTHRDAINQFLAQWQKQGESLHGGTWRKGTPDKFKVTQNTITGHVAVGGGMNLLMKKVFGELSSLVKVVENQVQASIHFENETSFEEDLAPTAREETFERESDQRWRNN